MGCKIGGQERRGKRGWKGKKGRPEGRISKEVAGGKEEGGGGWKG